MLWLLLLSVIFVFCLIPKFKFKKAIENNVGVPYDSLDRRGFSKQHINIGVIKMICDLHYIWKQKFDARERKIKQSEKTNSKIREIFAVQYIVVEYLYPNLFTVIQTCKCIWQYLIDMSKESVHSVDVGNSFSAVFMLFLKNLNSAIGVSCYDSASSLSSDYTRKTLGTRSSMVQEEPKSFKSQISQPLNNSNFGADFQWRKWEYSFFTTLLHGQFGRWNCSFCIC